MRLALLLGLSVQAACSSKPAAPAPAPAPAARPAPVASASPDAGLVEIDAATIATTDILEGPAATEAMNGAAPAASAGGEWLVGPRGLGPFVLGTAFAGLEPVARGLGCRPPASAAASTWTCPWLSLKVADGRLRQITVIARDPRGLTDEGVGVGSTMEDAALAHGDPRPAPGGGWVLEALPGVRVVTELDRPGKPADKPGARVVRLEILGPEALADED